MRMKTKKLMLRLLPVIILFVVINTGFGIEYALRIPREWITSEPAGYYNTLSNPLDNRSSNGLAVDTLDKIAYVTAGYKMLILDVADADNPILLSYYSTPVVAKFMALQDDMLILTGPKEFRIMDVSNHLFPHSLSTFYIHENYSITDVQIQGDYVYLAVRVDGSGLEPYGTILQSMVIVDISNPYIPQETAVYRRGIYSDDLVVAGNIAYLSWSELGTQLVDITNKSAPRSLDKFQMFGLVSHLPQAVDLEEARIQTIDSSTYIFVADGDNGYIIGDVTNPRDVQNAGGVSLGNITANAVAIDLSFYHAFILFDTGQVIVYSLNKPTKFKLAGIFDFINPGYGKEIYIHDATSTLYILQNNGLFIFNLVDDVKNNYYLEEMKFGYTWIAILLSMIICVPLAVSAVIRHKEKFSYHT